MPGSLLEYSIWTRLARWPDEADLWRASGVKDRTYPRNQQGGALMAQWAFLVGQLLQLAPIREAVEPGSLAPGSDCCATSEPNNGSRKLRLD
jgi:hypothetical protein